RAQIVTRNVLTRTKTRTCPRKSRRFFSCVIAVSRDAWSGVPLIMADHLLRPTVPPGPGRRQGPRACPSRPAGPALQVQDDVGARLGAADQDLAGGGLLQRVRAVADVAGEQRG